MYNVQSQTIIIANLRTIINKKKDKKEVEKKAIKVNCTDLDLQGRGVARDDKYVYFVEGLMPGDSANVLISNVKGKIATGKITKIIKQSEKK